MIMMISTKGRYALRMMADLAEQEPDKYTPLKDIAVRQEISQKYLESIMTMLSKRGLVDSLHGKGGGYRLNKAPEDYSVVEILRVTETSMVPVTCLQEGAEPCSRADFCKTLPMWKKFNEIIDDYFGNISLADIAQGKLSEIL